MSCCAPGTEGAIDQAREGVPSAEELWLSSRLLGEGRRQTDLSVPDVYCGACISKIETALGKRPEIERARVNLSTKRVSVVWRESVAGQRTDPSGFAETIVDTGYPIHLFQDVEAANDRLKRDLLIGMAVAGFASANIMLLSVSVWSGAEASTRDLFHWISAAIAGPTLVYSGRFFFRSAWAGLKHGTANMDLPISLAVILSYTMSLWETFHHGEHAWFDASVSLLFFLLIGRTLDHIMRDKARSAVIGLARISPRGAMVLTASGEHEYRPVDEIRPGDRLLVAAGERIPVDATVVSGESDIDWSIVNGESAPQPVRAGGKLLAGTLNLTGSLALDAVAEAKNSFLAEVISLMEAAEGGKAHYRRIADRAARIYSPAVHALALFAFIAWGVAGGDWKHAALIAISVLVITCPCALGLAVPVVQVIAAGRLFRNGIMVKEGSAMERLAEIDTVLFDKTGTLTLGRPRLVNRPEIAGDALAMAAGLARHSLHPLSRAIVAASDETRSVDNVREIAGGGVEAHTADGTWRLGRREFALGDRAIGEDHASTEVILSHNGNFVASFKFEDTLRPGVADVLGKLAAAGVKTGIVSGDREPVVARLAKKLGIQHWKAGLTPSGKVRAVEEASASGHKVLMVGDGINDAPALRSAHVSMAPSTAADIGRQAADFVFMRDGIEAITLAIDVSRKSGRLIRENFGLAIAYNIVAVPMAIAGHATPLVAAIAMSSSSLIVILNSLRLNRPFVRAKEGMPGVSAMQGKVQHS